MGERCISRETDHNCPKPWKEANRAVDKEAKVIVIRLPSYYMQQVCAVVQKPLQVQKSSPLEQCAKNQELTSEELTFAFLVGDV